MPTTPQRPGTEPQEREPTRARTGDTTMNQAHHRQPRLPHERDESADSQDLQQPDQHQKMQQAHDDIEQGLVDTDRGPVLDKVYREKVKPQRRA